MEPKEDLLKWLASPSPKGQLSLSHAIVEDPNLGVRKSMEDFTIAEPDVLGNGRFAYYCVLDGHGGSQVAKFAKDNFVKALRAKLETYKDGQNMASVLESAIAALEAQIKMIGGRDCGSTLCGVLIDKATKRIFYVNIGDSQALAIRFDTKDALHADFKCATHKVSNPEEETRVKESGGSILNGRLAGNLLVTRALGDFDLREYGLISTPDVRESELFKNKLVFIASDGVWDVIDREGAVKLMKTHAKRGVEELAKAVVKEAVDKGSVDNISLIIVWLL